MLEFVGDAICLSGLTGTRLKSEVIAEYYPFWWGITSGGKSTDYRYSTAIVELNAGTGEVYIKESQETNLGSAGHALELKINSPHTSNLKVVLVEENSECYDHLKKVIKRRWRNVSIAEAEGPAEQNSANIYLLNETLEKTLETIEKLDLGNSIFFFDPLRSVEWTTIEKTAARRIREFYRTGTEFLIFLFTSDWFLGRDDLAPLPTTSEEDEWTEEEKKTVAEADALFGTEEWRIAILNEKPVADRENLLVDLYKSKLHKWFRYVLPLPFNPKKDQLFHLILCSNYEIGVRMTRNAYAAKTGNPKYSPNNKVAFGRFKKLHPEIFRNLNGRRRPLEWLVLWRILTQHEDGRCDSMCSDLIEVTGNPTKVQSVLEWLSNKGYLRQTEDNVAWQVGEPIELYVVEWEAIRSKLGIEAPAPLTPLSPGQVGAASLLDSEEKLRE